MKIQLCKKRREGGGRLEMHIGKREVSKRGREVVQKRDSPSIYN